MEQTTKPRVTAADFFLQIGFIAAFYTFIITYVTFLFSLINTFFPDRQYNYYDPYGSQMRFSVSMLLVVTPLFLYLLKKIYERINANPERKDLWVRRWGLYATLFLSILALAVDLVILINTFLGGEITTRFFLKALTVILVAGAVWWHTRQEFKDTLADEPKKAKALGWGVILLVVISIGTGFYFIGSPTTLRDVRDDNQREADISNLRYQVVNYYRSKNGTLPGTLDELNVGNPYAMALPTDPATKQPYGYAVIASTTVNGIEYPSFQLCATFALDGSADERVQGAGRSAMPSTVYDSYMPEWPSEDQISKHPAGNKCFDFSIDPERYPVFKPAGAEIEKQMRGSLQF